MPDQIYAPGPEPAPLKYNVPGSQQMIPRACQALFNGSGASGDYVPALIFRSQAGHVISRAILDTTVTAGDDAEVSWFPGVKNAPAAAVATQSWLRVVAGDSVPSGSISLQNGTEMPIIDFITNDATRFVQTTASRWTMTRGVYAILGSLRSSTGAVVVANADFTVGVNSSSGFVAYAFAGNATRVFTTAYVSMTLGDQSSLTPWKMLASGAETHSWYGQLDIVHVLGA